MRMGLAVVVLLALAVDTAVVWGQMGMQTPAPAFGYFRCTCQPGAAILQPTPSLFGAPTVSSWHGTVYALSDTDARLKAKNACVSENQGSENICDTCGCFR
jgi:hypothetical protein